LCYFFFAGFFLAAGFFAAAFFFAAGFFVAGIFPLLLHYNILYILMYFFINVKRKLFFLL
jgi:hypothetical protein